MKAFELKSQLESDPEFMQLQKEKEKELQLRLADIKIIETPLIKEMNAHGYQINDSDDLLKQNKVDVRLSDLLLKWLPNISNKYNSQQTLVRVLANAECPIDGKILIQLFDNPESSDSLKWSIGNTIASANILDIDKWLELKLESDDQGKQNEMLVYAAAKYLEWSKSERILKNLFYIYPLQVADVLSMKGNGESLKFLQLKLEDFKGEVRKQITKYIDKLKKRLVLK